MKKIAIILLSIISINAYADKYLTKTGSITFYSNAPLETIMGNNRASGILLNTETNELSFSILIKSFVFEQKLMQEHFNENYLESDKYPKSTFKGKIISPTNINLDKAGKYNVTLAGDLYLHGVTRKVTEKGTITISNGSADVNSTFSIKISDYKIKIPAAVRDKVATDVKIEIDATLKKL